jgi:hypothetical protein
MAQQEMSRKQIIDCIKFAVNHSSDKIKLPVAIWGLHGVGKTQTVEEVAREMKYNLVVLHLATQDVADLIGIPRDLEVKDDNGNVIDKVTIWSCPDWLHTARKLWNEEKIPTIFFLDEMNRGNRMVLAAMLPFLINGVLHTHGIGPKDAVMAAMNPPTEDYEVNDLIDKALLNRMGHVIMRPTHAEYVEYLKSTGMDKITLSVLKEDPAWTKIPEFELPFKITPSRRSIDYVMRVVGKTSRGWVKEHASHIIECYLGQSFRDAWMEHFSRQGQSITLEMLIDYDNNKEEITSILKTEIDGEKTIRLDLLQKAVALIKQFVDDKKDKLTLDDANWMMKFFSNPIIDDEYAATVFEANKHIKDKMASDVKFSVTVGNFLREKKIWNDDGIPVW